MRGSLTRDNLIAEIDDWLRGGRVGVLHVDFGPGVIQAAVREERITAPPVASRRGLRCPAGHDALDERDYGAKVHCATCDTTFSIWALRESR